MARWISAELRQTVADRAKQLCEYCLIAEADTFYGKRVAWNRHFSVTSTRTAKVQENRKVIR
jgi:hypothetical protein